MTHSHGRSGRLGRCHAGRVNRWREGYLTREEVVRLLESGCRWSIMYCVGSNLSPVSGRAGTLPAGVLERVPTQAAKRKLQRGNGGKTYFRAEVRQAGSETVLELVEDL